MNPHTRDDFLERVNEYATNAETFDNGCRLLTAFLSQPGAADAESLKRHLVAQGHLHLKQLQDVLKRLEQL